MYWEGATYGPLTRVWGREGSKPAGKTQLVQPLSLGLRRRGEVSVPFPSLFFLVRLFPVVAIGWRGKGRVVQA